MNINHFVTCAKRTEQSNEAAVLSLTMHGTFDDILLHDQR